MTLVVGTRPQIIKSAPIVYEARRQKMKVTVINTGQHYDANLSDCFLGELGYRSEIRNLGIGGGTECKQLARIVSRLGPILQQEQPRFAIVPGDTNSALGAAIAALKEGVPVAHLEAGARSYDPTLPEEINRKMIDHCSAIMFAPSVNCALNLRREGIQGALVKTVGDTMYDLVKRSMPIIRKRSPARMSLDSDRKLVTVTVHRQATVDDRRSLSRLFQILASLSRMEFMVPLHPRTKKRLKEFKLASKVESIPNVRLVPPLGYLDMLSLVYRSDVVFTDSGGLQKEAFWIGVPCITLRENTEWVETVKLGANVLTGLDEAKIRRALRFFFSRSNIRSVIASLPNPYGNGAAAVKVVRCLRSVPQR